MKPNRTKKRSRPSENLGFGRGGFGGASARKREPCFGDGWTQSVGGIRVLMTNRANDIRLDF